MSDELLDLTRRVESLEVSLAGVLQRLPGDELRETADNRRALFELLTEAWQTMPPETGDLPAALAVVVDRLDKAGVRAPGSAAGLPRAPRGLFPGSPR